MKNNRIIAGKQTSSTLASVLFLAFCVTGILLSVRIYGDHNAVRVLTSGRAQAEASPQVSDHQRATISPERLVARAMQLQADDGETLARAKSMVEAALDKNPDQPFAWALLAYFDSRSDSGLGETGLEALRESYDRCLVCNRELIHWRLEFILANWPKVSEDIRQSAFESADFLRWWYLEYDYLAELRTNAQEAGIPFAAYQRQIKTPVRPNELPLAED